MEPEANTERWVALWVSSMRSPSPAKITEWSPITSPPRRVAKPISPFWRGALVPTRDIVAFSWRFTSRPLAAAAPSDRAVPEGASSLCLWCISTISMS